MGNTSSEPNKNNDSKQHKSNQQKQHSASSMPLSKSVVQKVEGLNLDIWNGDAKVLENIILDYSFEPKRLEHPLTKFWTPSLKQEILSLAYHAAPLDQVETYIKKAHAKRETHLPDTLVEAAAKAIKNGDVTLKDEKGNVLKDAEGNVIAEGMAEKLMQLHDELYPKEMKCINKVKPKLPVENEKDKKDREGTNIAAVNQVFDAIRLNNQDTDAAIKNFKEYADTTSPLNRIHLQFVSFDVLAKRGGDLPRIEGESYGEWWGILADRFCCEAIGAGIQKDLPPRIQQLLKTGAYSILNRERIAHRTLDVGELSFRGAPGSNRELGVYSFYGGGVLGGGGRRLAADARVFKTYYEHLHSSFHTFCDDRSATPSCS
jgi:hypothetical protein